MLGHLFRQWTQLDASQITVVHAADAQPLMDELNRIAFPAANRIVNPAPEHGMFSSIQCAASWAGWNPELTHWVITLGDQPHLSDATLRSLLNFGANHPDCICQPLRRGRRKHPVLLPKRLFRALQNTTAGDLKLFLTEHAADLAGFPSDDTSLDFDMDTPEDYDRLKHLAAI